MIRTRFLTVAFAALATSAVASGPIGSLDVDASYDLRAAGDSEFVRFSAAGATWFSGDTIKTRSGVAVLNFANGGAIGVRERSQVTVAQDDAGKISADLASGEVMVALTPEQSAFELVSGNFTVAPKMPVGRMDVSLGDSFLATVRRLEGGNLKVDVQSGEFHVRNVNALEITVSSGESVGLLDVPSVSRREVQAEIQQDAPFDAPEDVGPREEFEVNWGASAIPVGDYLAVAPIDSESSEFDSVVRIGPETVIPVVAPNEEGDYEIRIIDEDTGDIVVWAPLTVSRPEALLLPVAGATQIGAGSLGFGVAAAAAGGALYILRRPDRDPGSISP
jgi:hypothetical protein